MRPSATAQQRRNRFRVLVLLAVFGLIMLAEVIVGPEVWRRRAWRIYLWPGIAFGLGIAMWPVMTFFTNSAIHMYAHGSWAEVLMLAGGAELGLVHGRLKSRWWRLTMPLAFVVTGTAFIVHEQNAWYFARSAYASTACSHRARLHASATSTETAANTGRA